MYYCEKDKCKFIISVVKFTGLLKRIKLGPGTKIFIGIHDNENVTSERLWNEIHKKKLLYYLKCLENKSDLIEIENYPTCTMANEFYSSDKQIYVVKIVDNEELRYVFGIKKWKPQGTDIQIYANTGLRSLRPLYEIENKTTLLLLSSENIRFSYEFAQYMKNYTDMLCSRFGYKNILRQRINKSIEYNPLKEPEPGCSSLTQIACTSNEIIQTSIYHEMQRKLALIFRQKFDFLVNSTLINYAKQFEDNFFKLTKNYICANFYDGKSVKDFENNYEGIKLSCINWDNILSGLIVTAYVVRPLFFLDNSIEDYDYLNFIGILWSFEEEFVPILFLHADSEITTLSFCPYVDNIILGGTRTGQILIWDVNSEMENFKAQNENKDEMSLKDLKLPVATSNLDVCHNEDIYYVEWIKPDYFINIEGNLVFAPFGDDINLQFMSYCVNSIVFLWDLNIKENRKVIVLMPRKISTSHGFFPKSLIADQSHYNFLNNMLNPHYKWFYAQEKKLLDDPSMKLLLRNSFFYDEPIDLEELFTPGVIMRNLFDQTNVYSKNRYFILISTASGNLIARHWHGIEFDYTQELNIAVFQIHLKLKFHDNSVRVSKINSFYPHYVLAIGIFSFTVWNINNMNMPIFWKKSTINYVSGVWSAQNPFGIIMARQDFRIEIWNLFHNYKCPIKVITHFGYICMNVLNEETEMPCKKNHNITTQDYEEWYKSIASEHSETDLTEDDIIFTRKEIINRRILLKILIKDWMKTDLTIDSTKDNKSCVKFDTINSMEAFEIKYQTEIAKNVFLQKFATMQLCNIEKLPNKKKNKEEMNLLLKKKSMNIFKRNEKTALIQYLKSTSYENLLDKNFIPFPAKIIENSPNHPFTTKETPTTDQTI